MTEVNSGAPAAVENSTPEPHAMDSVVTESTSHPEPQEVADSPEEVVETPEESSEEKPKKPGGFQRKIDRLSQEVAQRDALIAELQGKINPVAPVEKQADGPKAPNEADFENVLDYLDAKQKYDINQALTQHQENQAKQQKEQAAQLEYTKKSQDYEQRADSLLETEPQFYEKAANLYREGLVTPAIENAVLDSPIGEQVTLHFINHPEELAVLRTLNEAQTYRAVALLEARLSNQTQAAVRQTKATAPITPLKAQASTGAKAPEEMSQQEFEKWRYGR